MITKAARIAFCAAALTASFANAEPFTYQGSLHDTSAPANGLYDFRFTLHSAQSGGSQIGSTVVLGDVPVTNGVFSVDLDFGDNLFQTTTRWLEIRLRDGDSLGSYTTLTPRTPISKTPVAQHATTAGSIANPLWNESGSIISTGTGLNRVLINRDTAISSSEYFGVYADFSGFVGMYMSGPANSLPFYGYSVDGEVSAYTFFSPSDNSWNVVGAGTGTALRVTEEHNVEVANELQAESFKFETPKLNYYSVSGDVFHAGSAQSFLASSGTGGAYIAVSDLGWLVAPVSLPDGAVVTRMRVYYNDTASGSMTVSITRRDHGGTSSSTIASVSTSGSNGTGLLAMTDNILEPFIENDIAHYHLRAFSSAWPGNSSLAIKSVVIEYTTAEAD